MSLQNVEISQLRTYKGESWLNIEAEESGRLEVHGQCHRSPTFLLYRQTQWLLLTFDSEAWAEEHLPSRVMMYDDIYRLTTLGPIPCNIQGKLLHDSEVSKCRACKLDEEAEHETD
ncbi:hypothetical protein LCGC14_2863780 [marine sediment metagenome]|uniref:Uncharacterized protein n=1 Tax=marine sediment metagenome TaxID=412755 RepID=A0A0F8Y4U7_9ZZZZ